MAEVTMPRLSDTMAEGSVGRWLKQPGDHVEVGDILCEIETDKATMELESFDKGTLQQILIREGVTVPIGQVIAIIGDGAAPAVVAAPPIAAIPAPAPTSTPTPIVAPPVAHAAPVVVEGERIKVSPVARRIAEELGVDLRYVVGTGPGGRIIKENVEAFAAQQQTAPAPAPVPVPVPVPAPAPAPVPTPASVPPGEITPMSRMRRAIARTMNTAKPGIPHIYVTVEVDMAAALELRRQINTTGASTVKISVNDMVLKAAAKALTTFPPVNSSFANTTDNQPGVIHHPHINVSAAVALDDGLVAPVITDADKKSLGTIASEIRDLATRAREGKLKQHELEGATFQVSNLGMHDVVAFASIITAPQAASLAVGAVRQVPVVRNGEIVVGTIMHLTISADHRVIDGVLAAQYLQEVRRLLEVPLALLV